MKTECSHWRDIKAFTRDKYFLRLNVHGWSLSFVRIWHSIFILVLKLVRDTFTYCIVGWGHRKWHRSILRRKPFFWLRCCHHRFLNRHLHQFTMAFHSFNGWSLSCIGISSLIDFNMVVRFVDVYHLRMIWSLPFLFFVVS